MKFTDKLPITIQFLLKHNQEIKFYGYFLRKIKLDRKTKYYSCPKIIRKILAINSASFHEGCNNN